MSHPSWHIARVNNEKPSPPPTPSAPTPPLRLSTLPNSRFFTWKLLFATFNTLSSSDLPNTRPPKSEIFKIPTRKYPDLPPPAQKPKTHASAPLRFSSGKTPNPEPPMIPKVTAAAHLAPPAIFRNLPLALRLQASFLQSHANHGPKKWAFCNFGEKTPKNPTESHAGTRWYSAAAQPAREFGRSEEVGGFPPLRIIAPKLRSGSEPWEIEMHPWDKKAPHERQFTWA